MLERMHRVMERIEELNRSFEGMKPRRANRQPQEFRDALQAARGDVVPDDLASTAAADGGFASTSPPPSDRLSAVTAPAPAMRSLATPNRYDALIQKYATRHGLDPALVTRLVEVESNFDPLCVSRKGALGLMQLMPATARELGVANPLDPEANIAGGTRYLAQLLARHQGDLTLALASYNAGPGAVERYGGIPPFTETRNFIDRVLDSRVVDRVTTSNGPSPTAPAPATVTPSAPARSPARTMPLAGFRPPR